MPTYEYECKDCGNHHEDIALMSAPLPKCPKCGGETFKVICNTNEAIWYCNPDTAPRKGKKWLDGFVHPVDGFTKVKNPLKNNGKQRRGYV